MNLNAFFVFRNTFCYTLQSFFCLLACLGFSAANAACVGENQAPFACSNQITNISFDWSSHQEHASGADNWPITWAADNNQYTAWGDGFGYFANQSKRSFGIAKIAGNPPNYVGSDVYFGATASCNGIGNPGDNTLICGKSYSILSYAGFLVLWAGPESGAAGFTQSRFFYSRDDGQSWTQTTHVFTGTDYYHPTFIQFDKDNQGPNDGYAYHYGTELQSTGSLQVQRPGKFYLARQKLSDYFAPILNAPAGQQDLFEPDDSAFVVEYFTGLSAGVAQWSTNRAAKVAVFTDPNGVGWNMSVSFNRGAGRYILMTEHDATFQSKLGIFEATEPWGPWKTVAYYSDWAGQTSAPGTTGEKGFFWNISNKWSSGANIVMIFTGVGGDDSFNTLNATLSINSAPPPPPKPPPQPPSDAPVMAPIIFILDDE